jgi:hypothetical protein
MRPEALVRSLEPRVIGSQLPLLGLFRPQLYVCLLKAVEKGPSTSTEDILYVAIERDRKEFDRKLLRKLCYRAFKDHRALT